MAFDPTKARPLAPEGFDPDNAERVTPGAPEGFNPANATPYRPKRSIGDVAGDIGVTALKGAVGLPQAVVGIADIPTGGRVGKALEGIGYKPGETQKYLDTLYSDAQQEANRKVRDAEGFVDTVQTALQNPSTILTAVGESIPQMIGGAGIARGLIKGAEVVGKKVAPWVAGALGEGTIGAGSAAEGIREQSPDGLLTPQQQLATVGSGAGTALFGALGGKVAQKLGIGDIDTILAQGGANASKKGFARQVIESGVSEGVFEELPQSIQEQMWQNYATGRPLAEGVDQAAAMGLLAGGLMGMGGGGFNALAGGAPQPGAQPPGAQPPAPGAPGGSALDASGLIEDTPGAVIETPPPHAVVETPPPHAVVETPGPHAVVETAKAALGDGVMGRAAAAGIDAGVVSPEQVVSNLPQGGNDGATGPISAAVAQAGGQPGGDLGIAGVPDPLVQPAGHGLDAAAGGTLPGDGAVVPAGAEPDGGGAVDDSPLARASALYARLLEEGPAETVTTPDLWREQIAEQVANPGRYHTVAEDENPKGLRIGDRVNFADGTPAGYVASVQDASHATAYKGGFMVKLVGNDGFGGYTGIANVEKAPDQGAAPASNNPPPISGETVPTLPPISAPDSVVGGAASVRRGEVGGMMAPGESVLTASGRQTTPFPKTSKNLGQAYLTKVDTWLVQNALDEAKSRGDEFNARSFEAALKNPKNIQQADKDGAEEYLFGQQPPVVPSILKPLSGDQPKDAIDYALSKELGHDRTLIARALFTGKYTPDQIRKVVSAVKDKAEVEKYLDAMGTKYPNIGQAGAQHRDVINTVKRILSDELTTAPTGTPAADTQAKPGKPRLAEDGDSLYKAIVDKTENGVVHKYQGILYPVTRIVGQAGDYRVRRGKVEIVTPDGRGVRDATEREINDLHDAIDKDQVVVVLRSRWGGSGTDTDSKDVEVLHSPSGNAFKGATQPEQPKGDQPKRSAQFESYRKWIEDGKIVPPGMVENIKADERLNDGEADELIGLAAQRGNSKGEFAPEHAEAARRAARAQAVKAKAERDLFVYAVTAPDALALAGTVELDGFTNGLNAKIVEQIETMAREANPIDAASLRELVQDGKPLLPEKFYKSAYKQAKATWAEQQKNAARDPQLYKDTLGAGMTGRNIAEGTPQATEYQSGFDHALKGKTRSTLPQGQHQLDGYEDARKWIKTEDGRAWFEGKPRQAKQQSTGEALKRVWDRARKDVDAVGATDEKAWQQMLKATARADWFPITLDDAATPGAKEWLDKFRDKIATFSEYYMRVMVADGYRPGKRWGFKPQNVFTGRYTSYKGRLVERFGEKPTDEQRLELSKEVAREYQQHLADLADKFRGLKSLADIQKVIEDTYGKPGDYKLGTMGVDASLYHDNHSAIEGLFPKKPDAWDYKYSTWKRLADTENAERPDGDRKDNLIRPRLDRIVRNMPDVRKGRSITAAEFKKTFNFADVTIGEYVTAQEAEDHLNYAYDALQSLALMLGAKPHQLSFGGKLHFSIGALGHGKFAAHFQQAHPKEDGSTVPVINVTKTRGDGTVLHEYFHAIDHMTADPKLKQAIQSIKQLLMRTPSEPSEAVAIAERFLAGRSRFNHMGRNNTPMDYAEYALRSYFKNKAEPTYYFRAAQALDKGAAEKKYWSNEFELWARAAESWGWDRLAGSQQRDDYLQSDWAADGKVTTKTHRGTPYPQGGERLDLNALMEEFVKAAEWTDHGPVLREGHKWHKTMPYGEAMERWNAALEAARARLPEIKREMEEREAAQRAEREAEQARKEAEALFGKQQAEAEAQAEVAPPTATSEPVGDAPLSEDELSAIFDEESSATREATQEEPEADAPGEKLDQMAWTKEDAAFLLEKVNAGQIVLVANADLGIPTIHDMPADGTTHMGYGVFRTSTPYWEGNWTGGSAMSHTPSGQAYTTVQMTRGEIDPAVYDKDDVAAKLRVLAGEPGKGLVERAAAGKAKREGRDLPNLSAEQEKTAKQLAGEFAKHGVKGLDKTLDGLVKLFGGGPNKLQSFPSGFDKDTYEKAKPLFREAAEEFRKAGLAFKDFVRVFFRTLIAQFGDGVKPYAVQFAKEYQAEYEAAPDKPAENAPVDAEREPSAILSDWVLAKIKAQTEITWQDLFDEADKAFGGTQANGVYTPKDAYDAVELAVNRWILDTMPEATLQLDAEDARRQVESFEKVLALLPTQSKRTKEMDEFQQFSTPPHFAYVANWVANLKYGETYLEPSAGVGGLALFGKVARARVIVNELSGRRLALLRNLPFDLYHGENAEQLNNVLPDAERPTVIVMNPPFSATAGRMEGARDTMNGAQHIEQALKFLQPGGRLVAIVGEGMAADRPAFRAWWDKIKKEYNVRANIGVDGSSYAKYGTTFDNQLLVIDKTGATVGEVTTGKVAHPSELPRILEAIRNDRPATTESDRPVADGAGSDANAQDGRRDEDTGRPGAASDSAMGGDGKRGGDGQGGRHSGRPAGAGAGAGQTSRGGQDTGQSGKPGKRDDSLADGGQDAAGNRAGDAGTGERRDSEVKVEKADNAEAGEITNSVFESYTPKKVRIPGAVPHNTPLVESAAMAAVVPPDPTYTPNLPKDVIQKGLLSAAQLEAVVYAGQAHNQMLRDGETRRGFFLGDGTGVGKGRQISGVILDNIRQGRTKAVWLSKKKELIDDAKRDFGDIGGDPKLIFPLAKLKATDKIAAKQGILFAGYAGLRSESRAAKEQRKKAGGNRQKDERGLTFERVRQVADWLGRDFDGVIVFDEAHEMGNAVGMKGARGKGDPSDQALAGLELQKALPKARIMYVSATGATEVQNLAYAPRLGLWGEGTPFQSVMEFVGNLGKSVSSMELVAQNIKQMGLYLARSLSFDGVTYDRIEHELTPYQRDTYDALATAWQVVLNHIDQALKETGVFGEKDDGKLKPNGREAGKIKGNIMSAFWGTHQRFFNQIITAAQMPSIIEGVNRDLKDGKAVVLQLTNTNKAAQDRAVAKAASKAAENDGEADDDAIEELDLTPRDQLITMLEKAFPVEQYEKYTDEEGKPHLRPVFDSEGRPVINKEALARRDALIASIRNMDIPDSPLQMLINEFGTDMVAEITGRNERLIRGEDGKYTMEKRSPAAIKADAEAFKDDKKRILVFSQAGGTGFSFHSDKRYKNQRQRSHYIMQAGWSADKAVQGFGRSHRTNQANAPIYRLVMTDVPAHKRFISSIARRLEQLGALTAGQRDTAGGSIFSATDNLESTYASKAVRQFFEQVTSKTAAQPDGFPDDLLEQMGLAKVRDEQTGGLNEKEVPETTKFLNRLLSLRLDTQEAVFTHFAALLEQQIDMARKLGTFDDGLHTIKHVGAEVVQEKEVYRDASTNADVRYIEIKYKTPNTFYEFDTADRTLKNNKGRPAGWLKNKHSGRVAGVWETAQTTTNKEGVIEKVYGLWRTSGTSYEPKSKFKADTFEKVDAAEARKLWEAENAERPDTKEHALHMVVGGILPLWDRFNDERVSVSRIGVDDGRRFLGRQIFEKDLADTLNNLNVQSSAAQMKGHQIIAAVMKGQTVDLSNGWTLKKVRVSNEPRIEVALNGKYLTNAATRQLGDAGAVTERIEWKQRYFVPTDTAKGGAVLDSLMQKFGTNPVSVAGADDTAFSRAAPFYSPLAKAIEAAPDKVFGSANGLRMWLNANAAKLGLKRDEIAWSGIEEWLALQAKPTRDDVLGYLKDNGVKVEETVLGSPWVVYDMDEREERVFDTQSEARRYAEENNIASVDVYPSGDKGRAKYGSYQTPGGENYRELLLTMPTPPGKVVNGRKAVFDKWAARLEQAHQAVLRAEVESARTFDEGATDRAWDEYQKLVEQRDAEAAAVAGEVQRFKSAHFDQPNVLAHVRFNERTDADGKKVLFIEEIQSDWAQKGKKNSFDGRDAYEAKVIGKWYGDKFDDLKFEVFRNGEALGYFKAFTKEGAIAEAKKRVEAVPAAPFVTDTKAWVALALKRMIAYAAENGFDRVAWTTGAQQADRYDLAKSVDRLTIDERGAGYQLVGHKDGNVLVDRIVADATALERIVGKDITEKAVSGKQRVFEGQDLRVGGDGMKAFYDQIVPQVANDVLKKLGGGKVDSVELANDAGLHVVNADEGEYRLVNTEGDTVGTYSSWDAATKAGALNQPGFDITPALRARATGEGLPLFKAGNAEGRAAKLAAVKQHVANLTAKWKNAPEIVVVADMNDPDVPAEVREYDAMQKKGGAAGEPEGFFHDGKVWVVASQVKSAQHAAETVFHEVLGHYGLRGAFGGSLDGILREIVRLRRADVMAKAKEYGIDTGTDSDLLIAAEEVLAEMAQTRPEIGFVRRAIAAIRNWLRAHGIDLKLTDADIIQAMILPARRYVEGKGGRNEGSGTFFVRAGDTWAGYATRQEYERKLAEDEAQAKRIAEAYRKAGYLDPSASAKGQSAQPAVGKADLSSLNDSTADYGTKQTDSPEFKRWFGKSRVQNMEGKPAVVYHGTQGDFAVFDKLKLGSQTTHHPTSGLGFFFAQGAATANNFGQGEGGNVMPVYLKIENPYRMGVMEAGGILDNDMAVAMRERLQREGYDGIRISEGGIWVAFEPTQIKSAAGNNGQFDGGNPDIRFSRSASGNPASWDAPENTGFDSLVYKLQNKHIDTKRVIEAVTKAGRDLADQWNPYLQEELFHGRAAKRTLDFVERELNPTLREAAKLGLTLDEIDQYLHARHAEEANALIAERNPDDPDMQDGGSGMETEEARTYLEALAPEKRMALETVADRIDAIIAGTRELYVDYGLVDGETVAGWAEMFQHYVPLMREDHDGGMGIGQGFSIKGKEAKHRTGSKRAVVDILANIAMQREKAIVRGEKNRVAVALAGLAKLNPNPGFWTFGKVPVERVFNPRTGLVEERPDPTYKSAPNVVVAKIRDDEGRVHERAIVFNKANPRAERMAEALKNLDVGGMEGLLGVSAKVTRYFASVSTQWNPVFGFVNLTRDVQGALLNLNTTPLKNAKQAILKDTFSALKGIYGDARAERSGGAASSKWAELWEEFTREGGQTGYRDMFASSGDRAKAIQSALDPTAWMDSKIGQVFTANGMLKVPVAEAQKRVKWLFDLLSDFNLAMENGVRLAAYKAALDKGMSRQQAASLAKNLTVNFNRKGQSGMQAGALYAFFNASMQGTARMAETLVTMEPGKVKTVRLSNVGKAIVKGGLLLGVMQAVALAGYDDDEPPEFVRERNLIIPFGSRYITIPMPLGFHVIPNIGRIATDIVLRGNPGERMTNLVGVFAEAFNPLGGSGLSLQTVAPTAIDPFVGIGTNKDWTGRTIYREDYNKLAPTPGFTRTKDTASAWSKWLAEAINTISGGTDYRPGAFSPTPDEIDYLAAQLSGGVGRELSKLEQTVSATASGEELPSYKVPLLGRYFGSTEGQAPQASKFYANLREANELEAEIKGRRLDRIPVDDFLAEHPGARTLVKLGNDSERQVSNLRKMKRQMMERGAPKERIEAIDERITTIMRRFNERTAALEE